MPIPVACQCGQKFQAKETLAGKRVKCPKCGGVLSIPNVQQPNAGADDPLGLGDVSAFEQSGQPMDDSPLGEPASPGVGSPLGAAPPSPSLGSPSASPLG
ncbi:MAG: hypothetical protein IH991_15520, partial [Planctomycetes bacterium]|nr:hypothetical protein [Planctomycetota bacterium]